MFTVTVSAANLLRAVIALLTVVLSVPFGPPKVDVRTAFALLNKAMSSMGRWSAISAAEVGSELPGWFCSACPVSANCLAALINPLRLSLMDPLVPLSLAIAPDNPAVASLNLTKFAASSRKSSWVEEVHQENQKKA